MLHSQLLKLLDVPGRIQIVTGLLFVWSSDPFGCIEVIETMFNSHVEFVHGVSDFAS